MSRELVMHRAGADGLAVSDGEILRWSCRATAEGQSLHWDCAAGTLHSGSWLQLDLEYLTLEQATLRIELRENDGEEGFFVTFSMLPLVRARLRLPLTAARLNAWALLREEALLKRCCYGQPVDPALVTSVRLQVERMAEAPVAWEMDALQVVDVEPPRLQAPELRSGPLVDGLGQSLQRQWMGRTSGEAELVSRLRQQREAAEQASWPAGWSRWGGWTELSLGGSGWFRMERHGSRWWLVDPDGYAYWSAAMDCVRMGTPASIAGLENAIQGYAQLQAQQPDCFRETAGGSREWNVVRGNFGRAFDASEIDAAWGQVTIGLLRQFGFNGFGNWSDSKLASANAFPYVIPLREQFERTPCVFRDFPDVWHPAWQADLADYAAQLVPFADDRALIGYFLMNEPKWGFAGQSIAEGMLLNTPGCPARRALAAFLRERYADDTALAAAWQMPVSMAAIADGPCLERISAAAKEDLSAFSTVMAERFFSDLTRACKAVDAQHLNLGVRYYTVPPQWLAQAMRGFDVFSLNAYEDQFPAAKLAALHEQLGVPIMVGEWHFGALDAGLPMAGICRVADQAGRGAAYRSYLETAAAQPWCVGAHYFQLYDQPYLGRFDGENWNIGLLDTCNRVHTEFAAAALAAHRNMYAVASGKVAPFSGPVSHRPRHFC